MRIGLAQIISGPDPVRNLDLVAEWADRAARESVDLLFFPEATMRCVGGGSLSDIAEPVDGSWVSRLRGIATEAGLVIGAGMYTPTSDGRIHNTLVMVGQSVDARYDKIHLFDAFGYRESDTVAPGADLVVVEVAGARIGLTLCYDVRFPGLFTALARRGAQLICVPASWGAGPGKVNQWDLLTRARALDAGTVVAAVGQADPTTAGAPPSLRIPTGVGHSRVISPYGQVMAELGAPADLLVVDLDLGVVSEARQKLGVLDNDQFAVDTPARQSQHASG